MNVRRPSRLELEELRGIAEFQFGVRGEEFIPDSIYVVVSPNTHKIRLVLLDGKKYLSLRSRDYRFNLHVYSGLVLNRLLPQPLLRVYVKDEYGEFIAKGGTLFSRHVLMADPNIRPGDEVLVVDSRGELLAVGRSRLAGWEMTFYNRGEAVKIREGVTSE